jgi:hypothetical protein
MWCIGPLLDNGSVNSFQQILGQHYRSCVFCGPCRVRCYVGRTKHFSTITDVFSIDPPRDYISIPFVKRNSFVLESAASAVTEWERMRMGRFLGSQGRSFGGKFVWLWLRVIVKEAVSKSDHLIQKPLLSVTEPRTRDSILNTSYIRGGIKFTEVKVYVIGRYNKILELQIVER